MQSGDVIEKGMQLHAMDEAQRVIVLVCVYDENKTN